MGTTPDAWSVERLTRARDGEGEEQLIIPNFQRSVVWKKPQKDNLISSLQKGYPVGALMLFVDRANPSPSGRLQYRVVDGLQRLTAICEYQAAPLEGLSVDVIDPAHLAAFHQAVIDASDQDELDSAGVDQCLLDWLSQQKQITDDFDSSTLLDYFQERLGTKATPELKAATKTVLNSDIRKRADISGIKIPVIIYDGNRETLADVFRRINTAGTVLGPYDILNALWTSDVTEVRNKAIRHAIAERYEAVREVGFTVESRGNGVYNLYEYLLGLGKSLSGGSAVGDIGFLLSSRKKADQADSLVFSVAGVCHRLRSSSMARLPDEFERGDGIIRPASFEKALVSAIAWLRDCLARFIGYDFKSSKGAVAHTELQLASLIARVMIGMYEPKGWQVRLTWKSEEPILARSLPRHYLYDVLRRNWAGSGDSRLFNTVWSADKRGRVLGPSNHYLHALGDDDLLNALIEYFESSRRHKSLDRESPSVVDRLILKIIYSDKLTNKSLHTPMEIEHLIPIKRLKSLLVQAGSKEGWAINSIGNLAALDKKTNREKRGETLSEWLRSHEDERERVEQYLFVSVDDVAVPKDAEGRDSWTEVDYERFLEDNFQSMAETVLKNLK